MSGQQFWVATATDSEGDLHWSEVIFGEFTKSDAEREFSEAKPRLPFRCTLEVFGPFDTARPLPAQTPFAYDPATHIFNYARSSWPLYQKLLRLHELRNDAFAPASVAMDARALAGEAMRAMRKDQVVEFGEIRARHILQAALMFLEWDGEQ